MSKKKIHNFYSIPYVGVICAFISVIFWSSASLCIKIAYEVHALEALAISSLIQAIIYLSVIILAKQPIAGVASERIPLVLRCTFGTISLACLYMSYRLISLSDATTIRYTAPVFVSIFAFIILNEPFGLIQIINAVITITGVLLIGKPSFLFREMYNLDRSDSILGVALALIAAISIALSMTVMRKLQKTPSAVVIFWFSSASVVFCFTAIQLLQTFRIPKGINIWVKLLGAAFSGAFDQLFITLALKLENAAPVSVVRALSVVISFIFSATILDERIEWTSLVGGALIFISIVFLGLSKWYCELKTNQQNKTKQQMFNEKECTPLPILVNYCLYNTENVKY